MQRRTHAPDPFQHKRYDSVIRVFGFETSMPDLKFAAWQVTIFFTAFIIPILAHALWPNASDMRPIDAFGLLADGVLFAGVLSTLLFAFGLDSRALSSSDHSFPLRLAIAILVGGSLVVIGFHLLPFSSQPPGFLAASLALAFLGILATRKLFGWIVGLGGHARRTIIVGAGETALKIHNLMDRANPTRYELVGFYPTGSATPAYHA